MRMCEICATLCLPGTHCTPNAQVKLPEITFFDLVTLTYDLDHRTHPRYCLGTSLYQILGPWVQQFSRESADRHTHTDGWDRFYYLLPRLLTREVKIAIGNWPGQQQYTVTSI